MAPTCVAGELYVDIDGQMWEIKRQLRQKNGYPYDPMQLVEHLQAAIEGNFVDHNGYSFKSRFDRPLKPFTTIKLGIGLKNIDDFRQAFKDVDCDIVLGADKILEKIQIAKTKIEIDLVMLTTAEITGKIGYRSLEEVFAGAARLGLEKCPAEVGPQLCLQYRWGDPELIAIGMDTVHDSLTPKIFVVYREKYIKDHEQLLLSLSWWGSAAQEPDLKWVFVLPRK